MKVLRAPRPQRAREAPEWCMLTPMLRPPSLGLLLCLGACAPPDLPADSGDNGPSIRIIYPESSQTTVLCSTFMVVVDVDGIALTDFASEPPNKDGQGHWHLLDSAEYITATAEEYAVIPADSALEPGTHRIVAALAQNDHQPFDPDISWFVEVQVGETQADGVTPCVGAEGGSGSGGWDTGAHTGMDY